MSDEPEVITALRYLHDGKVDWLTTECTTTGVTISAILAAYDDLRSRLEEAEQRTLFVRMQAAAKEAPDEEAQEQMYDIIQQLQGRNDFLIIAPPEGA